MQVNYMTYGEGRWFAVPLRDGGYAMGIITRGSSETKGGLGYFFGPRYPDIPASSETYRKNKDNAAFIVQFGDLGITSGHWPLIPDGKPFVRDEWPVPLFHRIHPLYKGMAVIVEYGQDYSGLEPPINEKMDILSDGILKYPKDGAIGSAAVEIELTKLLRRHM